MADAKIRFTAEDATRAALASVQAGLKSLERDASLVANSLRTAFAGASVSSLVALGANAVRAGAEINNLAERTGLAAGEIQFLKFAAAQADVDLQTLATGMKKLSLNAAEAAAGSKEQAAVFNEIGVATKNADGSLRKIDDILGDVADVFATMPEGVERTALSVQLFGKAGDALLPFLAQGREGLAGMREEFDKLGIAIDDRTIKQMAKFDDQLEALKAKGGALSANLFAPVVETLSQLADTALRAGKATSGDLDRGFAAMINARNDVARAGGDVEKVIAELEARLGSTAEVAKLSGRALRSYREELAFLKQTQADQGATVVGAAVTKEERELARRQENEQAFAKRLREIKGAELDYIKSVYASQTKAYEDANKAIDAARQKRIAIEQANKEFAASLASGSGSGKAADLTDVNLTKVQAREALQRGEFDTAIKLTEQAKAQLKTLQEQGEATLVLQGAFREIAQIQQQAAAAQEDGARTSGDRILEQIQRTLGQAEALKKLQIGYDEAFAKGKTQELLAQLQAELAKNPLVIPVVPGQIDTLGKSILGSSNVTQASPDAAPEPAQPQTQINLTLGNETFALTAEEQTGIDLAREFQRAALKRGRR